MRAARFNRTALNWKQHITNRTHEKIVSIAIAALALSAISLLAGDTKAFYEDQCAKCHGSDGKGGTKMGLKLNAKDYTDAAVQANLKDEAAFRAIKDGFKDKDGKTLMKPKG